MPSDAVKRKVLVGMSGGVDSSVCALLLKKQGYEITGVTFRLSDQKKNVCDDKAVKDAEKVCRKLNIKHIVVDRQSDFQETVVNPFVSDYLGGKTPNPCVVCNRHIKFPLLFEVAQKNGIDMVSTGHYAFTDFSDGMYILKKGISPDKDQSYFLHVLKQEWLDRIIFPLGNYTKDVVRRIAGENDLVMVKDKKDSFDICFIDGSYKDFISETVNAEEITGDIVFIKDNRVLGKHDGIYRYTIGQSRGLGISHESRLFVHSIDAEKNIVYVDGSPPETDRILIRDVNRLSAWDRYSEGEDLYVKIRRYSKMLQIKRLSEKGDECKLVMEDPVRSVTPGQYAVVYSEHIVLGGGEII